MDWQPRRRMRFSGGACLRETVSRRSRDHARRYRRAEPNESHRNDFVAQRNRRERSVAAGDRPDAFRADAANLLERAVMIARIRAGRRK